MDGFKEIKDDIVNNVSYTINSIANTSKNLNNNNKSVYSEVKYVTEYQPSLPHSENFYKPSIFKSVSSLKDIETVNPIQVLMSQEPDFMPNMYNIYFILVDRDKDVVDVDMSKHIQKTDLESGRDYLITDNLKRWSMIGTRIESISFPQKKQSVSTLRYAGNVINKLVGKYERTTRIDLNINLDQSMYILDAFHALNGDFWATERKKLDVCTSKIDESFFTGKYFYNALGVANQKENSTMKKIDLIVEYDADYFTFSSYHDNMGTLGFDNKAKDELFPASDTRWLSQKGRIQRYIFHDCKFLGHSSSIQFSQDANPISATFPFVFRKIGHLTANSIY